MANNFQSIVGGIFRGISQNKSSAGLSESNVKELNPQTYQFIGLSSKDPRYPVAKEQTQNPALPWNSSSAGTQLGYTQPIPTNVPEKLGQQLPAPDAAPTQWASSIGSMVQPVPGYVPLNNWQINNYGMSPQNGSHFLNYFANQRGIQNLQPIPVASNVLTAVQEQQNIQTDGSADVWNGHFNLFRSMAKDYNPSVIYGQN